MTLNDPSYCRYADTADRLAQKILFPYTLINIEVLYFLKPVLQRLLVSLMKRFFLANLGSFVKNHRVIRPQFAGVIYRQPLEYLKDEYT